MQAIAPLTVDDFKGSVIVIGKIEIDIDGAGDYQELPDVQDFAVNTNIEDEVSRFCAYSFSITCLNTNDRYFSWNTSSAYFDWLKQGRRIKIYAGIKTGGTEYFYQWIIGRVDNYSLSTVAGEEICTINGRDFMRTILDYKLIDIYWGSSESFNTTDGGIRFDMNAACKGCYLAYIDSTTLDGSTLVEIHQFEQWSYNSYDNQFVFATDYIPSYVGTANLKVYYYTAQDIEDCVGHILYLAGIFATTAARDAWIANAAYVTPTGETIDRVWFKAGTSAFKAISLLAEVAQYRFYFDYAGNPIFKPKPTVGVSVDTLTDDCITNQKVSEDIEEVYNDIVVIGETVKGVIEV